MSSNAIRYACGHGDWHDTYTAAQNDPGRLPPAEPITDEQFARLRALLAANTTPEEAEPMTDTTSATNTDRGGYVPPCGDTACREGHCRDCGTHTVWTAEAWGDAVDCPHCGRHDFHSIGD